MEKVAHSPGGPYAANPPSAPVSTLPMSMVDLPPAACGRTYTGTFGRPFPVPASTTRPVILAIGSTVADSSAVPPAVTTTSAAGVMRTGNCGDGKAVAL